VAWAGCWSAGAGAGRVTGGELPGGAMSRRVYLLGVGLALLALALAVTDWAFGLPPEVTEAKVRRVRPGMNVQEVEALLAVAGPGADAQGQRHQRQEGEPPAK